jgi:MarR family transcriptional regulator, organic hydroperoxide resistance regulator
MWATLVMLLRVLEFKQNIRGKSLQENIMPVKFSFENPQLKTWMLLHQAFNSISKCEDIVFTQAGLSTQQHTILMAIKYIKAPATPSEIAKWIDRNVSSITMIVERMEKDGLVERIKDTRDRRFVAIVATEKGKLLLEKATMAAWKLVQEVLADISAEEFQNLDDILDRIRQKAFIYSRPNEVMEEIQVNESRNIKKFMAKIRKKEEKK